MIAFDSEIYESGSYETVMRYYLQMEKKIAQFKLLI